MSATLPLLGSAIMGMEFVIACPKGYEPKAEFLEQAKALGGKFSITDDPKAAAKDADIIYTDVWVSMGDEAEQEKRLRDFASGSRSIPNSLELQSRT